MAGGFLPPKAPDGNEPARWEAPAHAAEDGGARVVVATTSDAAPVVRTAEVPPRNGHALWSLGIALAGVGLLVLSVGLAALVTLPAEVIAIVLGRRGRRRAEREGIGGRRAARWGIAVGIVGIALALAAATAWILVWVLDLDVRGSDSPNAPTEFSTLAALLTRHL
jgi:hypothetical protein